MWFVWAVPMINNNQCYLMDVKQCRWLVLMSILINAREKQEPIKNGHSRHCTMLHLFDDLWLDKIIPKNNDEGSAIYGKLENKINTLYWTVENSIPKNNDRSRL